MQYENTIDSMCQDHCDEIERRKLLYEQQGNVDFTGKCGFHNAGCTTDVFMDTDQMVFVFSISHEAIPPRSRDPTDPGVRIYGAFPTQDLAAEFGRELATKDAEISILTAPMQEWNVMSSSIDMLMDTESVSDIKSHILAAHESHLQHNRDEFEAKRAQVENNSKDINDENKARKEDEEKRKKKRKTSLEKIDGDCKLVKYWPR